MRRGESCPLARDGRHLRWMATETLIDILGIKLARRGRDAYARTKELRVQLETHTQRGTNPNPVSSALWRNTALEDASANTLTSRGCKAGAA